MKKLFLFSILFLLSQNITHAIRYGNTALNYTNGTSTSCPLDGNYIGGSPLGGDSAVTIGSSLIPNPVQNSYSVLSYLTNFSIVIPSGTMQCIKWDGQAPTCGTWTPNPHPWTNNTNTFTLAGSTDAGGSGISVAGGTCTTPYGIYLGTCSLIISDVAGNTTVCTSPGARVDMDPPSVSISYDLSNLTSSQTLKVIASCNDWGLSGCATNWLINSNETGPNSWSGVNATTYEYICTNVDLNVANSVSSTNLKCAGTFQAIDNVGNTTIPVTYKLDGSGDLSALTAGNFKTTGITQKSSETLATTISTSSLTSGTQIADNFSSINTNDIKLQIRKNVEILLKGVDRSSGSWPEAGITNITTPPFNKKIVIGDKTIFYFKDRNVVINCSPYCNIANNITYIIERGNLYIKSNLNYSAGGMLG
ncbi:MAG: hypothetical protein PHY51_04860, partial [Candidatus Gracilibacteria bacterium]|nr:hypothetical protein [Candidatus Gracilibacteria bacterium]